MDRRKVEAQTLHILEYRGVMSSGGSRTGYPWTAAKKMKVMEEEQRKGACGDDVKGSTS